MTALTPTGPDWRLAHANRLLDNAVEWVRMAQGHLADSRRASSREGIRNAAFRSGTAYAYARTQRAEAHRLRREYRSILNGTAPHARFP